MKKIILIAMCICLPLLWSGAHAEESKKFSYCGGNIKFYIPAFIDRKSLEKQSEPYTCKHGFTLKSTMGKKKTHVEMGQGGDGRADITNADEDYLAQFKSNYPHRLNYVFSSTTPNGMTTIITVYWLDINYVLKQIDKEIIFNKKGTFYTDLTYTANPDDSNDILFMNALEQLFLSAEIDW
jgi:hypothetical protein